MRYQTTNKRKLNIEESFEGLILREDSFKVDHIFECGQCFNFRKNHDGSYTAVFLDKIINLLEISKGFYDEQTLFLLYKGTSVNNELSALKSKIKQIIIMKK